MTYPNYLHDLCYSELPRSVIEKIIGRKVIILNNVVFI